jgi:hypothetical protein
MRVIWNGEALKNFSPSKAIPQGHPISPLIFILCMEILSHLIMNSVAKKLWKSSYPQMAVMERS